MLAEGRLELRVLVKLLEEVIVVEPIDVDRLLECLVKRDALVLRVSVGRYAPQQLVPYQAIHHRAGGLVRDPVGVDGSVYLSSGAGGTAPAVVHGVVYVGGDGSASRSPLLIHAIDAVTGKERWRQNIGANVLFFALDAATGEER